VPFTVPCFPPFTLETYGEESEKNLERFQAKISTTFLVLPTVQLLPTPPNFPPFVYPFSEGQGRPLPLWPWSVRDAAHRSFLATPSLSTSAPL